MTAVCPANLDEFAAYARRVVTERQMGSDSCRWCQDDVTAGTFTHCICAADCGNHHCPIREAPSVSPPVPTFRPEGS